MFPLLDKSSLQYPHKSHDVLGGRKLDEHISDLETNDPTEYIEYLDKVLSPLISAITR